MVEIEKHLFGALIEYVNALGTFYSDSVPQRKLGKLSDIRMALSDIEVKTENFLQLIKRKGNASSRALNPINKPLRGVLKAAQAISLGLENGDLASKTAFREAVTKNIKPLMTTLAEKAQDYAPTGATEEDLKQQAKFLTQTKGHKTAVDVLKKAANQKDDVDPEVAAEQERIAAIDSDAAAQMKKFATFKSKLPSSLKGKLFTLVEVPVVPYVNFSVMTPSFLRTTGLEFKYLAESFPVLEKQHLLAFDFIRATTDGEGKRTETPLRNEKTNLKARKTAAKHHGMQEQFILDILDEINKRSSEHYTLMSSHFEHHPENGRIAFAWIVPRRVYKMFERKANMADARWGFPWSKRATSLL